MAGTSAFDFEALLRNVGLEALDRLVEHMQDADSLSAARLACRGLRDAIDGNVQHLHVLMLPEHMEVYLSGQLPSLERWPRCTSVIVTVSMEAAQATAQGTAAFLLMLPFHRLEVERRRQIRELTCEVEGVGYLNASPLCPLALWLPGLRHLRLHQTPLSYDPLQLGLMYEAIASLPYLELLTLPGLAALEGIGKLGHRGGSGGSGSRLSRLEVWHGGDGDLAAAYLQQAVPALSRLQYLQALRFIECIDATTALHLLASRLPPSLESLAVVNSVAPAFKPCTTRFAFSQGQLFSVAVDSVITLQLLLTLVSEGLFPSLAPGRQLEGVSITALDVTPNDEMLEWQEDLLGELKRWVRHLQLGAIHMSYGRSPSCRQGRQPALEAAQVEMVLRVVRALGAPQTLGLHFRTHVQLGTAKLPRASMVCVGVDSSRPGQLLQEREGAEDGEGAAVLAPEAAARMALCEAVERMAAAARQAPSAAGAQAIASRHGSCGGSSRSSDRAGGGSTSGGSITDGGGAACADTRDVYSSCVSSSGCSGGGGICSLLLKTDSSDFEPQVDLLLLRGPFVVSLCLSPEAVSAWAGLLALHAASLSGHAYCFGSAKSVRSLYIRGYQLVPCAGAILLAVHSPKMQAVVAAAARAAAMFQSADDNDGDSDGDSDGGAVSGGGDGDGGRDSDGEADAGGGAAPEAALDIVPLGVQWTWTRLDANRTLGGPLQDVLIECVGQVLQDVRARGEAPGDVEGANDGSESEAFGVDGSEIEGSGACGVSRAALEWALRVRDRLAAELPPAVLWM